MTNPPVDKGDTISLHIDRLSNDGSGVGRFENFVVFVPFSAPGDELRVAITQVRKSYALGECVEVLRPSPYRVAPQCKVFGQCGGCNWQHVDYDEQLRQKEQILHYLLSRYSWFEPSLVSPIVPSPELWHYRNRIQIHWHLGQVGFFRRGSHQVVDTADCAIASGPLNQRLREFRAQPPSNAGRVELSEAKAPNLDDAGGFAQVNSAANQRLRELVVEQAQGEQLLDLYCGSGNFTFPLARYYPRSSITGVELNSSSIELAEAQRQREGLNQVRFHAADVGRFLRRQPLIPDLTVILDPPRVGCDPLVISQLARLRPLRIVYISCNPATFARDIGQLMSLSSYRLTHMRPLDMFPHTAHLEILATFERL